MQDKALSHSSSSRLSPNGSSFQPSLSDEMNVDNDSSPELSGSTKHFSEIRVNGMYSRGTLVYFFFFFWKLPPEPDKISAIVLGDPWFWGTAWDRLKNYTTKDPLDLSILDFHFMGEWLEKREVWGESMPPCYYVDMRSLKKLQSRSTVCSLKEHLSLSVDSELPKALVFILMEKCPDHDKPFLLVLNYRQGEEKALILGIDPDSRKFMRPKWFCDIWKLVAEALGWKSSNVESITILLQKWTNVSNVLQEYSLNSNFHVDPQFRDKGSLSI